MAHDIEGNRYIDTGKAWHDVGRQNVEGLSIEEAIQQVHPELLCLVQLQGVLDDGQTLEAPESYGVYRSDGKYLGHVGDRFELLQPIDTLRSYQALIDTGLVQLETAGLLCDGRKLFVTAKVKDSCREIVKGDVVDLYFTISSGLCGNMSHRMFSCAQRTVCANTLAVAERQGKNNGSMVVAKHTRSIHSKLDSWITKVEQSLCNWESTIEQYKAIAAKPVQSTAQIKSYFDQVFEVDRTTEVSTKTENKIDELMGLFESGKGADRVEATFWRGYNAVTEYLTHFHGHNEDTRLDALYFGESAKTSKRALALALEA